jgi:glycosyltransferase involved in cell wall biosynthesis
MSKRCRKIASSSAIAEGSHERPRREGTSVKVAVITPYYRANRDWLAQCHESVRAQTHPSTHILVADGTPESYVDGWEAQHIVLMKNHGDFGDTPRAVGTVSAIGQGFDAIAYLDADNWYAPEHIESLVKLHDKTGAAVCTASRNFHRLDGTLMGLCPFSDGETFVDTSCLFLTRKAFRVAWRWALIPPDLHALDDRVMWHFVLSAKLARAHTGRPTMAYRTAFAGDYRAFGEEPPPGADKTGAALMAAREAAKRRGLHRLALPIRELKKARRTRRAEP